MHTEKYCKTLDRVDPVAAIRAIHEALLQLMAVQKMGVCEDLDNWPAIASLSACLKDAGHIAFVVPDSRP